MNRFRTPILLIIYRKIDATQIVFNKIREIKPKYLYVAANCAREGDVEGLEQCEQTRKIIQQIDWDCELKTLFRKEYLEVANSVSSAVSWFFDNVEEGIILEDDCLPHNDFFEYCEELLEKYRNDERISVIGGTNLHNGIVRGDASYFFAYHTMMWGWASWRRFWKEYDLYLQDYSVKEFKVVSKHIFSDYRLRIHSVTKFKIMKKQGINTWDFQVNYYKWKKLSLGIVPNVNLVSNIGFSEDATNCINVLDKRANLPSYPILPLIHPSEVIRNTEADNYHFFKQRKDILQIIYWEIKKYFIKSKF